MPGSVVGPHVTVVVGVDGAGRTHRLNEIAAAATGPVIRINAPTADNLPDLLAAFDGGLVLVDDAHRFGAEELRLLTAAARQGVPMVVARRPTITSRELAELDEAVGASGSVHQLLPLDADGVSALVASVTGRPTAPDVCAAIHARSAGLPAVAVAVATAPADAAAPALVARVQRKLAMLDLATAGLARLLALRLEVGDSILAEASGMDSDRLAAAVRTLRDEGMLSPAGEAMIPAVAEAILADLPAAERRRTHELIATALVNQGGDPSVAAAQLRAARVFVPAAAPMYRAVADRARFTDPAAAIGWYDDALEAGSDPATVAVGRAEAAALIGLSADTGVAVAADEAGRLRLVDGAVEAHQGRAERAAEALSGAAAPGPVLAVVALVATGQLDRTTTPIDESAPVGLRRFAEAAIRAVADPGGAVPLFIEAAEAIERTPPAVVLPDTPHALGALVASLAGDAASGELLLDRALRAAVGGPVAVQRHRLLLAWVRMRSGRYDTAVAEVGRLSDTSLPGRERLMFAALAAGLARRSGDVAKLREAWTSVEPVLSRRTADLFSIEAIEELAVAATRLRRQAKVAPVLADLDGIVTRLGRPAGWVVSIGWAELQIAIAAEDADGAARAAGAITDAGAAAAAMGARQRAQVEAAERWASVLAGEVDPEAVVAAAEQLAAVELPWEGSRLVGQAAIRTSDPAAARRLLERARELSSAEVVPAEGRAETQHGGLSEREVEVARMVLDGGTYREIGARLFISPKTVEHHVARIRTKLGATSRAEFIAAIRDVLQTADQP